MPLICLASPTGGTGRTVLAAHLAREFARLGRSVIALDLDPQNALAMQFGIDLADAFGFAATLRYAADPRQAWRAALRSSPIGVSFLPFGQTGLDGANAFQRSVLERPEMLVGAVRDMLGQTGVIVVADLPAGPSAAMAAVLPLADLVLVPVVPDPTCVTQIPAIDSGRFFGAGRGFDAGRLAFVLNRVTQPGKFTDVLAAAMTQHLGTRLIGTISHDDRVVEAMLTRGLLSPPTTQTILGRSELLLSAARDIAALTSAVLQRLNAQHPLSIHAMAALAELSPLSRTSVAQELAR